jgi:hypothetical protein
MSSSAAVFSFSRQVARISAANPDAVSRSPFAKASVAALMPVQYRSGERL